jgi:preprotein translocase SecE subunit
MWPTLDASSVEPGQELFNPTVLLVIRIAGALVLGGGLCLLGANVCLRSPGGSDYLIDMDTELRKVVWPAVQPMFDPKAEAWGNTYIVILFTVLLTIFLWFVDSFYGLAITEGLMHVLFKRELLMFLFGEAG